MLFQEGFVDPDGLLAEHEIIPVLVGYFVVPPMAFRGKEEQTSPLNRRKEGRYALMDDDPGLVPIIEPRALEMLLIQGES